jgi:hypothetical protein
MSQVVFENEKIITKMDTTEIKPDFVMYPSGA